MGLFTFCISVARLIWHLWKMPIRNLSTVQCMHCLHRTVWSVQVHQNSLSSAWAHPYFWIFMKKRNAVDFPWINVNFIVSMHWTKSKYFFGYFLDFYFMIIAINQMLQGCCSSVPKQANNTKPGTYTNAEIYQKSKMSDISDILDSITSKRTK